MDREAEQPEIKRGDVVKNQDIGYRLPAILFYLASFRIPYQVRLKKTAY